MSIRDSYVRLNDTGWGGTGGTGGAGGKGGKGTDQIGGGLNEGWGFGGYGGYAGAGGNGGGSGMGGGVYHGSGGSLTIRRTKISENETRGGAAGGVGGRGGEGGAGGDALADFAGCNSGYGGYAEWGGSGGRGGSGGAGGGIYSADTTLIEDATMYDNQAGPGGAGGTGGQGGDGGQPGASPYGCPLGDHGDNGIGGYGGNAYRGGNGGAIYLTGAGLLAPQAPGAVAKLTIHRSTLEHNFSHGGGAGGRGGDGGANPNSGGSYGGDGGDGGNGGFGGGLFANAGSTEINNSTISDNRASGNGGAWGWGGSGQDGDGSPSYNPGSPGVGGGAYVDTSASLKLRNVTVVYNQADGVEWPSDPQGEGGGLYSVDWDLIDIGHTMIGFNTASTSANCKGRLVSAGYNLFTYNYSCSVTGSDVGNRKADDFRIGPLEDNGGYTKTHALLFGSPALDRGFTMCADGQGSTLTTDQRGSTRPFDAKHDGVANCDIGAFESQGWVYLPLVVK